MNTPMVDGGTYQDSQGTIYNANQSDQPLNGDLLVVVFWRKSPLMIYCDAARINDGKFQFNLTRTDLWFQMTFSPITSRFVPA